jgi:hypothetical protein
MKVKYTITREALADKDFKSYTKTTSGSPPKERSTDALSELLRLIKKQ